MEVGVAPVEVDVEAVVAVVGEDPDLVRPGADLLVVLFPAGPDQVRQVLAAPPDLWSDAHGVLTPLVVTGLELPGSTNTSSPSL